MSSQRHEPVSTFSKRAFDNEPYCADQGIQYLCGAGYAGLSMQSVQVDMPAGGVVVFEEYGLSRMYGSDYFVVPAMHSLSGPSIDSDVQATFNLAHGQTLTFKIDRGGVQTLAVSAVAAVRTSGNAHLYALAPGYTLSVKVDGGSAQPVVFEGTAAAVTSGNAHLYALTNGDTLTVKVDGEAVAQTVTFLTADFVDIANATATEVAAVLTRDLTGATAAVAPTNKVRITSDTFGSGSGIEVTGGAANVLLAFSTAPVAGTGIAVNLAAATATEVAAAITADITGAVAAVATGNKVKITSNRFGTGSKVQVTGGTANTALGFLTTEVVGTGDASNITAMTLVELQAFIEANLVGGGAAVSGGAVYARSDTVGPAGYIECTGGTANVEVGFPTSEVQGGGVEAIVPQATRYPYALTIVGPATHSVVDLWIVGRLQGQLA